MVEYVAGARFGASGVVGDVERALGDVDRIRAVGTAGDDVINGSDGVDVLIGGAGRDTLNGGNDDDTLFSANEHVGFSQLYGIPASTNATLDTGDEADTLIGGAGDDYLFGGYNDTIDGGTSVSRGDFLYLSLLGATSGVTMNFADSVINNGTGTIRGIENIARLQGSNFDDDLTINGGTGYGSTIIHAMGGNDRVIGGAYTNAIYGGDGNDFLDGRAGTYLATIDGGSGDDTIYTQSNANNAYGGDGNDTIYAWNNAYGGNGNDTIFLVYGGTPFGEAGDDTITGGAFGERIFGGSGADILRGGFGDDRLMSGGSDSGVLTDLSVPDSGVERDRVFGDEGNDSISVGYGDDADGGVGTNVLYLSLLGATNAVTLDLANLTNGGSQVIGGGTIRNFQSIAILWGSNFGDNFTLTSQSAPYTVYGMGGDDTITGTSGADTIDGGDGADYLNGGAGADTMTGGAGNDTYVVDSANDVVNETGGSGIDTVLSAITYTLGSQIENLTLTGSANIHGTGNLSDNILTGNSGSNHLNAAGGNDTVLGGDGDDVIDGGTGTDQLFGGAGNDTFHVDRQDDLVFEDANGGTDTAIATGNYYLYANIENLTLSGSGDLFGVGNELANTILGNSGSNLLIAGAGDDTVRGGAGVDSLFGESGNDQLFGDAGIDYLVGGIGNDTLDGGTEDDALYGEDGDDILIGGSGFHTDILVGGAGNDILRGDSGEGDYDRMDGGAGDDSYYVDTPDDLTFEAANGGTDTVYANITGAGYYLYANVENLVLGGNTPFGVGNELNNRITGSASANWLLGGAGDDILNGGAGNDVLFGEAGADTFVFTQGTGGDVIGDFTTGTDRIDLTAYGLTWQTVINSMHENGGTTAIDLGNGDFIVLNGVTRASLSQSDFILSDERVEDKVPVMEHLDRGRFGDLALDVVGPAFAFDMI